MRQIRVDRLMQLREDNGLLGRYSGPEVRTWEVSEPETFSMVGIILSQKMYPILCPPYRHIRTVAHSQPHATVSTKLLFFSSNAENGGFVLDGPPALGAGGPRFKSGRPDQKYLACFLLLIESAVHLKPRLWNSGRQECLIRKSFSFLEFAT